MHFLLDFVYSQLMVTLPIATQSYEGKTVIVTGSNVGLGLEACKHFAKLGVSTLVLAVRDPSKGETAKQEIVSETNCNPNSIRIMQLDLASYDSVKGFASKAAAELERVDVLLENAGIATTEYKLAEDNESTITTNVVSTFLLALLMLPKLKATAEKHKTRPNLTIVSSEVHKFTDFPERNAPKGQIFETLNDKSTARMTDRYNVSKLLEVFVVREWAALTGSPSIQGSPDMTLEKKATNTQYPVTINCLNPGLCHSSLNREAGFFNPVSVMKLLLARTTEMGSRTLVHAAGAGPETHGEFCNDCAVGAVAPLVTSPDGEEAQKRVWTELKEKLEKIEPGVTSNL